MSKLACPTDYVFKGQCYDTGEDNPTPCALCGRLTRFVFILKDTHGGKISIGPCSFRDFEVWNPELYKQLTASKVWLETSVKGELVDTKKIKERDSRKVAEQRWKRAKKEALQQLREYHQTSKKGWLPENLYSLQEALTKPLPKYKSMKRLTTWLLKQSELLETLKFQGEK